MKPFYLYNTMSRSKELFQPIAPGSVGMYCCGPTVYNYAHIGNLRSYVFEDVLCRTLGALGLKVNHVMNITDVGHLVSDADEGEDKMATASRREGKSPWDIAKFYEAAFFADAGSLNIRVPTVICRATGHINEMIALIQRLEANGHTYVANGNVYLDTSTFDDYGAMARLSKESEGVARVETDVNKRNSIDSVLWFTKSKFENQAMKWESPWGIGYPGWHIECSAMSIKYLGEQFDIHCGGIDHVNVHHTNEIAQTEGATGKKPWVRWWVHGDFLNMGKVKMAKSGGGFVTVASFRERGISPLAYRMFLYSAHYRSQLAFSWEGLESAVTSLCNLKKLIADVVVRVKQPSDDGVLIDTALDSFWNAICDDMNIPQAMAAVWELARDPAIADAVKIAAIGKADTVLGLDLLKPDISAATVIEVIVDGVRVRVTSQQPLEQESVQRIAQKIVARKEARKNKDFALADAIRNELAAAGVTVKDLPDGSSECVV